MEKVKLTETEKLVKLITLKGKEQLVKDFKSIKLIKGKLCSKKYNSFEDLQKVCDANRYISLNFTLVPPVEVANKVIENIHKELALS
jgi:hypothetical protein|tara:strand:- start:14579 stop:14839 length:261 start_codon:yes stop_codon:yes gene_type:complete